VIEDRAITIKGLRRTANVMQTGCPPFSFAAGGNPALTGIGLE
jgi:hypothetical protein